MVSAYVVSSEGAPDVSADLAHAGIAVAGAGGVRTMVAEVIRAAPDLLVCYEDHPDDALFAGMEALNRSAPRPTVVFTTDADAEKIERATRAGVHSYVVNGYGAHRLRPVIHAAQARFRHLEVLRAELADIHHRFSERKLIDQAKALLMRLRNLPEDEAYGVLRTAAMKANRRMGQIARQVIEATRFSEAVNRAGQLRMTSQRLVKLQALLAAGTDVAALALRDDAIARTDAIFATLARTLSRPTFGDLIDQASLPWGELKRILAEPPARSRLPAVDALAERFLAQAEQLTAGLETAGLPMPLRLINVSGRQRMLSQRFAKQALLTAMLEGDPAEAAREALATTTRDYEAAMVYLRAVPLSTEPIAELFATAGEAWSRLSAAVPAAGTQEGRRAVLEASETLLRAYDDLTDTYERHLQVLLQA